MKRANFGMRCLRNYQMSLFSIVLSLLLLLQTSLAVKSTVSGTITALLVEDGTTVTPGTPLVTIAVGEGGAAPPPAAAAKGLLFFSTRSRETALLCTAFYSAVGIGAICLLLNVYLQL